MSESPYAQAWFYGPMATAAMRKSEVEVDARQRGIHPPLGDAPLNVDVDAIDGAFMVVFLKTDPVPKPADMKQANGSFGVPVVGTF
jgi:hypothetical protein